MKRPIPKALRINCPGWHDPSTGRTYSGGDIIRGPQINDRILTAYYDRETFVDRFDRKERLVCEEVYVPEIVPADQELRNRVPTEKGGDTTEVTKEVTKEVAPEEQQKPETPAEEIFVKPERRGPGRPAKD